MLPTTYTCCLPRWRFIISPRSETVVVFPLVPVTAMTVPSEQRYANSISPQIGIPASRMRRTGGISVGTPGLMTHRSSLPSCSSESVPSTIEMSVPFGREALTPASSSFSLPSYSTGLAPMFSSSLTEPIPLFPAPTTSTFLSFKSCFTISPLPLCGI